MDADDDMLVLIVGDDTDEKQLEVKEENASDGQANYEEEMESLLQGEADYLDDDDAEYVPKKEKRSKTTWKTKTVADIRKSPKKETTDYRSLPGPLRGRMLKPSERKSYVKYLLKECPELAGNEQLLVDKLANIMKKTKPPAPPEGFYRLGENPAQFICQTCDAVAPTIGWISRHYQNHHGEFYLVCYACGVTFRNVSNLYKHEKNCQASDALIVLKARAIAVGVRGDNRPFLGPKLTDEDRKRRKNEKQNLRKKLNPKRYHCSYCSASYVDSRGLDAHENLHRGERPYVCDYCMAPYSSYLALARHRKTHEPRLFICDHCGKSFKQRAVIQEHLDRHNLVRRYACGQCDKTFSQKPALTRHILRVHDNLPLPCPCQICPKRYGRITHLKDHMRKKHGMELITRSMFIRSLPKLAEVELNEAKVIKKKDVKAFPYVVQTKKSPTKREPKVKKNKKAKTEPALTETNIMEFVDQVTLMPQTQAMPNVNEGQVLPIEYDHENENKEDQRQVIEETNEEVAADSNQIVLDISNLGLSADVLRFVQQIQAENKKKIVLLNQGNLVHLVESESDAEKLMEQLQYPQNAVEIEDISKYNAGTAEEKVEGSIETQLREKQSDAETPSTSIKVKSGLRKIRKKK